MTTKKPSLFQKIISFPFYFFFLGNFSLIALWAVNKTQVSPIMVLPTLLINCAVVLLVWLVLSLIFRSFAKGSKISLVVYLLLFTYGHVYDLIQKNVLLNNQIGFVKLLAIYLVLGIVLFFLARKKNFSKSTTILLNVLSLAFVLYNATLVIISEIKNDQADHAAAPAPVAAGTTSGNHPDIYYIVLDAYSRQDVLSETFNFDNSAFLDELRQRGFFVADCSNSNYDGTLGSISTTLNYSYRNPYKVVNDTLSAGWEDKNFSIANNNVRQQLAGLGYKFVTARGYSAFNDVKNSDLYLDVIKDPARQSAIQQSQFGHLYAMTTLLRSVFELYTSNPSQFSFLPFWFEIGKGTDNIDSARYWFYQTNYVFDSLAKLPLDDEKYFVYAHINSPHAPFVFDREGNFRFVDDPADIKPYYVDSIVYLNKRVLKLVDQLISESSEPPIIIIQGDHGTHMFPSGFEKHKILNAYYFGGRTDIPLYETITPVNSFRLVLKYFFGEKIDLLPDQLYVKGLNEYQIYPSTCDTP